MVHKLKNGNEDKDVAWNTYFNDDYTLIMIKKNLPSILSSSNQ